MAIAADSSGNVLVTGYSAGTNSHPEFSTIKYSSSLPIVHLDFQRLGTQLVMAWTNSAFSLQSAPAIAGPFANILGATSPYTNSTTGPQQYFRLSAP